MNYRPILLPLVALATLTTVAAQTDEEQFAQRQAKALNAYAKTAFGKGFPRIAKVVWLQTIKLYDPDNEEAWTSLGYVRIGKTWNPDPKNPYPTKDTGSGSDGKPLRSKYEALKKTLAKQHRAQAQKYDKAGRADQARKHWQLVLRWVDDDEQAKAALSLKAIGALSGTDLEETLYERSKAVEKAVEEQSQIDYPIETVQGIECGPLERAQIPYITVKSEHFVLHGDADEEQELHDALNWSERALRVCEVAFPWPAPEQWMSWAFFPKDEVYKQVLKANQVPDLEWKLEHSKTSVVGGVEVGATAGKQVLLDACVRNVAQGYSRFGSTGFNEGIGHTFVGRIFNNNRLFAVDRKRQEGTTASEEDREYQSPDFDVWRNLSLEMAWRSTGGVPANELPFVNAAEFTNEERIKAWSFCDYMMRRDPKMLLTMDRIAMEMKSKRQKQPAQFEQMFGEQHADVTIPQLDKEWEDFWTEASPVLKAIQNNTPPVNAISKGVDKWLTALNEARKQYDRTPVTWSANFSTRCKEHAEYLKNNKDQRGPAAEHTQKVDLNGSYTGSLFAQMALVDTNASVGKAKKMFERWIYLPGYRDALLNNTIRIVGLYTEGNILVINATSGIGEPVKQNAGADCYPPRHDSKLIFDREVAVADLGPEAEELLAKHGREGQQSIGFPLTIHFGGSAGIGARGTLACNVQTGKGVAVDGVLVFDGGEVRTTSAPGMATFWPLDPLPKGQINFSWNWIAGQDNQQSLRGSFSVK